MRDVYRNGNLLRMIEDSENSFFQGYYGSDILINNSFMIYQQVVNTAWCVKQWLAEGFVLHEQASRHTHEIALPSSPIHFRATIESWEVFESLLSLVCLEDTESVLSLVNSTDGSYLTCDGFELGISCQLMANRLYADELVGTWNPQIHSVRSLVLLAYFNKHFPSAFKFVDDNEEIITLCLVNNSLAGYSLSYLDREFAKALHLEDYATIIRNSIIRL